MPDLFDYPKSPGFKEKGGTSQEAAESMAGRVGILRGQALATIKLAPATADEVAAILGETVLAIRPRISELHHMGLIDKTGARRINASGRRAWVWRFVEQDVAQR